MFALAFGLYFIPSVPDAEAATTGFTSSVTQTVIGYAIPNASGLSVVVIPFILPILVTGLLLLLTGYMGLDGDISSFIIKFGLLVGCLLGMLSLTASAPTLVPIAFPIDAGVYLVTYIWKKV